MTQSVFAFTDSTTLGPDDALVGVLVTDDTLQLRPGLPGYHRPNAIPQLLSAVLSPLDTSILYTFTEGLFHDAALTLPVIASDFTLTFHQNGGAATGCTIASIKNASGGTLVGGESVIKVNLTVTGTPSGPERITIVPAVLYGAISHLALYVPQATLTNLPLNAGPQMLTDVLASNNSKVTFTYSEGLYHDVAHTLPVVASDYTLTFAQNGGTATGCVIASIKNASGGTLVGGETTIVVNLTVSGTVAGTETIRIVPAVLYGPTGLPLVPAQATFPATTLNP